MLVQHGGFFMLFFETFLQLSNDVNTNPHNSIPQATCDNLPTRLAAADTATTSA